VQSTLEEERKAHEAARALAKAEHQRELEARDAELRSLETECQVCDAREGHLAPLPRVAHIGAFAGPADAYARSRQRLRKRDLLSPRGLLLVSIVGALALYAGRFLPPGLL